MALVFAVLFWDEQQAVAKKITTQGEQYGNKK